MSMIRPPKSNDTVISKILDAKSNDMPDRGYKRIHASDLTKDDFCPRKVCLVRHYEKKLPPQRIPKAIQLTFDMGNHIADLVIETWAKNLVIGDWECRRCKNVLNWSKYPAIDCKCGSRSWRYKEVCFKDIRSWASGGIDTFMELNKGSYTPIELKIMSTEQFNKLETPLAEHRLRTQLYLDIIDNSEHPQKSIIDTSMAKVFYVSRGHGKKHPKYGIVPFKEYDVYPDPDAVKYLHIEAIKIKHWEETGVLPPRVCNVEICPKASKCPVGTECFRLPD